MLSTADATLFNQSLPFSYGKMVHADGTSDEVGRNRVHIPLFAAAGTCPGFVTPGIPHLDATFPPGLPPPLATAAGVGAEVGVGAGVAVGAVAVPVGVVTGAAGVSGAVATACATEAGAGASALAATSIFGLGVLAAISMPDLGAGAAEEATAGSVGGVSIPTGSCRARVGVSPVRDAVTGSSPEPLTVVSTGGPLVGLSVNGTGVDEVD